MNLQLTLNGHDVTMYAREESQFRYQAGGPEMITHMVIALAVPESFFVEHQAEPQIEVRRRAMNLAGG